MGSSPPLVCLGVITGPHGVRGEVKIKPYTGAAEDVAAYGPVRLGEAGPERALRLTGRFKGGVIGRLELVSNRREAEALKGVSLYVPEDRLPAAEEGSWYQADLVGLRVEDAKGQKLGLVVGVQNFGAGDLLEIEPAVGGETVFLSFTAGNVPDVLIGEGRLVVDPPEDLFEEPSDER